MIMFNEEVKKSVLIFIKLYFKKFWFLLFGSKIIFWIRLFIKVNLD